MTVLAGDRFPRAILERMVRGLGGPGRIGCTRFMQTAFIAPPAAGTISVAVPIRFAGPAFVLAMYANCTQFTLANPSAFGKIGVSCQIGGTEDLFVDGTNGGGGFLPLTAFAGGANWVPILRRAQAGVDWVFRFKNLLPVSVEDTSRVSPSMTLAVVTDEDISNMVSGTQ